MEAGMNRSVPWWYNCSLYVPVENPELMAIGLFKSAPLILLLLGLATAYRRLFESHEADSSTARNSNWRATRLGPIASTETRF
jgi:hypothetical protein